MHYHSSMNESQYQYQSVSANMALLVTWYRFFFSSIHSLASKYAQNWLWPILIQSKVKRKGSHTQNIVPKTFPSLNHVHAYIINYCRRSRCNSLTSPSSSVTLLSTDLYIPMNSLIDPIRPGSPSLPACSFSRFRAASSRDK